MGSPEGLDEVFKTVDLGSNDYGIKEKHVETNQILSRSKSKASKYDEY